MRYKGWYVKQSFSNDFVHILEELYHKYGEEVFSIQGIANRHMDIVAFSKSFFKKSSDKKNVADISVDDNANVKESNITQYNYEQNKSLMKLNSLYMMYKCIKELYSEEDAALALEKVVSGELFINDLHTYATLPYCYAFDLRILISEGMNFFDAGMKIKAPQRSDSFISLVIQSTAYISNQIAGASSYPDFFVVLNKFYELEMGENYIENIKEKDNKNWYKVKNQFQNLIYSLNFPFRGNQSAFTNLSVMDQGFMKSLFDGYVLPPVGKNETEFTEPNLNNAMELSKLFFEYFSKMNGEEGIFTFPVMTLAISLDENNEYIDPEFVDWAAKANSDRAFANIFQSTPNSFSSCCRLKNQYEKVSDAGYQNSFGVGGLSIGSHRVAGINMPRIAKLEKKNPNVLNENLEICHKILIAHREIIKDRINGGFLPLYTSGWIHLKKQYSTIGFIGAYEYIKNSGLDIKTEKGISKLSNFLKTVEDYISKWQIEEKDKKNIYNIEQIPGESMAVRLAEIDKLLKFNKSYDLYSNQYIPLIEDASIYDRFRIQGEIDGLTSGGAILHLNVDDEKPLQPEIFKSLMKTAKDTGTVYFAVNYCYTEFDDQTILTGKHEVSPITGSQAVCQYTRVVGFVTPVKSWNKTRRNIEFDKRVMYTKDRVLDMENKT